MAEGEKTFTGAMLDFFGRKEGQGAGGFAAELKELDEADRAFLRKELERVGYKLIEPR